MSDDDEDICRFGTPLDPIKEDEVPSKKPITIADQIAVDSNGRRRFHGAFTGGFSAGFWNTVGSKDGWTPQTFKSSRAEKATHAVQKPNDFMDEEDMGEFGIAPQSIQTREDFTPNESTEQLSNKNKRKIPSNSSGPIPGVPVLHLVLESCRDKVAVRLLKRMEPKLAGKILTKVKKPPKAAKPVMETEDTPEPDGDDHSKVYQCDMGPFQRRRSVDDESDESDDSFGLDDLMFAPDEFDEYTKQVKDDRFGLEYVGLDKGSFFGATSSDVAHQKSLNLFSPFEMVDKNNKRLSIKGQAFGVGAFEIEDDDIYAKDDMSKYDFLLGGKAATSSRKTKAIENSKSFIDGFVEDDASVAPKVVYRVNVPRSYEPRNWLIRRTRFGPATVPDDTASQKKIVGRHEMKPSERGQLLNEATKSDKTKVDADAMLQAVGLKSMNFVTETPNDDENGAKQQRSISPSLVENVSDVITKIDASMKSVASAHTKFEPPAIVPFISDRFVSAGASATATTPSVDLEAKPSIPETVREVKMIRTKSAWLPCQLLRYKMNIEVAEGTKADTKTKAFSLFSCLAASNEANGKKPLQFMNTGAYLQDEENEKAKQSQAEREAQLKQSTEPKKSEATSKASEPKEAFRSPAVTSSAVITAKPSIPVRKENAKKTELELKIIDAKDKHPAQKKDIYKAIFDSSDEETETEADEIVQENVEIVTPADSTRQAQPAPNYQPLPDIAFMPKSAKELNILRNTSPPRGIFSGLNIKRPTKQVDTTSTQADVEDKKSMDLPADSYGPTLPPSFQHAPVAGRSISTASADEPRHTITSITTKNGNILQVHTEEQWVEKESSPESKHKKEKKVKKKNKKERKKDKHKSSHHREKKKKSKR